jgi:hypothetical protein
MIELPFSLSPDAVEWVDTTLRPVPAKPELKGFVPILLHHWQFPAKQDDQGKIEYIYDPCFSFGWYPPTSRRLFKLKRLICAVQES